jgi:hypothetical protein
MIAAQAINVDIEDVHCGFPVGKREGGESPDGHGFERL